MKRRPVGRAVGNDYASGLVLRRPMTLSPGLNWRALLEDLDALEAFQDVTFCRYGAGAFETAMLGHGIGTGWC